MTRRAKPYPRDPATAIECPPGTLVEFPDGRVAVVTTTIRGKAFGRFRGRCDLERLPDGPVIVRGRGRWADE